MIKKKKTFFVGISFVAAFLLWTLLVCIVDVQKIGPQESSVGFATLNGFVHQNIGVHMSLYTITDWLGLAPIAVAFAFAVFGLVQWIQRKSLTKVDYSILTLGVFYIAVMVVFALFEFVVINHRPVLIEGILEASYPSSTTMLAASVMPASILQFHSRIKNKTLRWCVTIILALFTAFMVIGRLISGVHWLTDIVGGLLISAGLVLLYDSVNNFDSASRE